jgi:hypothetical protein
MTRGITTLKDPNGLVQQKAGGVSRDRLEFSRLE